MFSFIRSGCSPCSVLCRRKSRNSSEYSFSEIWTQDFANTKQDCWTWQQRVVQGIYYARSYECWFIRYVGPAARFICVQEDCKWCSLWRGTAALQRRPLPPERRAISRYTGQCVISFTPTRKVRPSLRRFIRSLQIIFSIICRSLIPLVTKIEQ